MWIPFASHWGPEVRADLPPRRARAEERVKPAVRPAPLKRLAGISGRQQAVTDHADRGHRSAAVGIVRPDAGARDGLLGHGGVEEKHGALVA